MGLLFVFTKIFYKYLWEVCIFICKERTVVGAIELPQYSYKIKNCRLMHLIKETREPRISNHSVLGLAVPVIFSYVFLNETCFRHSPLKDTPKHKKWGFTMQCPFSDLFVICLKKIRRISGQRYFLLSKFLTG